MTSKGYLHGAQRFTGIQHWLDNTKRLVLGRPAWNAEREFRYYAASDEVVAAHRARQEAFQREAFAVGLKIVRALDLLDAELLCGARVLELGAGECVVSETVAFSLGASEVWAVDAVPKQVWAAAEKHGAQKGLHFVIADAADLPFDDGQFDVVVAHLVLHHIHPLDRVLAEAFRVLAPGGRFAAFEPNPLLGALIHERTSENEAPISPRSIMRVLRNVGFASCAHQYWWSRLETSRVGLLSPGYRVRATKPGCSAERSAVTLRRSLTSMCLPRLQMDSGCRFAALADAQAREILACSKCHGAS